MAEPRLILIVEHDLHVRQLQQFFLEKAGFGVAFSGNGTEALASAQASRPAALVTEILVPGMDGLTLCRRIREDASTRDIPVIVFSILAAAARARDAGATAFLRKPFVESTFVAAVHAATATHAPEQQSPGPQEPQWASM